MTARSVTCEPSNCVLFVLDAAGGAIPEYVPNVPVLSTESAIMICCQSFMDGSTRVTIGLDKEVDPSRPPVHDQMLATPKRLVRVETVEDVVVEHPVKAETTRVRIWTNDRFFPDDIIVGLS